MEVIDLGGQNRLLVHLWHYSRRLQKKIQVSIFKDKVTAHKIKTLREGVNLDPPLFYFLSNVQN